MRTIILVSATIAFMTSSELAAQKAKPKPAPAPAPLEVSIKQVYDRRGGQHFERLEITLELPGVSAGELSAARVLLRTAVDDSGRSLLEEDAEEPGLQQMPRSGYEDEDDRKMPARLTIELQSPARSALAVKQVAGEIELYMPSKDPNGTATIPKFLSFKGKPLSHKALKANGVEIALVSDQQYETEKKRLAELKRKEMIRDEYSEETITSLMESFLEYYPQPEPNDVVLRIKDPKNTIQSVSYLDASGAQKTAFLQENGGFMFLSNWEGPPEAGWSLRVDMLTAKNLIRRPFVLADVPLP